MTHKRALRIFCPTHEAAFEVVESPKILCEITEHALSVGFPNSEFWEFCCNCETFTPSKLDKGEKVRKSCYGCGNEISKHFACSNCKTFSFESEAQTKGKRFFITNKQGIEPNCPGCQSTGQNGTLNWHECEDINTGFFTVRETCPFCLKNVSAKPAAQNKSRTDVEVICPKCRMENPPTSLFCGNCRFKLKKDAATVNVGTDINKTKLLGSLCPNCSMPMPPNASFCGECGQAVKNTLPPPRINPSVSERKTKSYDTKVLDQDYAARTRPFHRTETLLNLSGQNAATAYQTSEFSDLNSTSSRKVEKVGLPENVLSALPYLPFCIGFAASFLELFYVPRSEAKVRFHAAQGLVAYLAWFVTLIILGLVNLPTLASLFNVVFVITMIVWTVKALQKKPVHIEFLDTFTKWINKKCNPRS